MLVAIEGLDGSGKRTQTDLLLATAREAGMSVDSIAFPRYGETRASTVVRSYLNGELGAVDTVSPWLIAPLYALDRYESRFALAQLSDTVDLVVIDRFTASNLAYHGTRLPPEERESFWDWMTSLEHDRFGLPHPDLYLYLHMPVAMSRRLVLAKERRSYTDKALDLHEADLELLAGVEASYTAIAARDQISPWCRIDCLTSDGTVRPETEIAADVWAAIQSVARKGGEKAS